MKKAIILTLIFLGYQFLCSLLFVMLNVIRGVPDAWATDVNTLSLTSLLSGVMMAAHLICFREAPFGWRSLTEVPTRPLLLCLPLLLSAMYFLNVVNEMLALPNWSEQYFLEMSRNLFGVPAMVLVAPFVEELLFRGAIERHFLLQGKRPLFAIVISALFFGVVHGNPAQMPFAFLLGLLLGWLYYRTGSIVPGVLCHVINNGIAVLTMWLVPDMETADIVGGTGSLMVSLAVSFCIFAVSFYVARKQFPHHAWPKPVIEKPEFIQKEGEND